MRWGRLGVGLVGSERGWNEGLPSVHVKTHNKVFDYGVSPSSHMAKLITSIIVVNKLKISYDFRKKAHGELLLRHVPRRKHTTNYFFVVCQNKAHGELLLRHVPKKKHTAKHNGRI